MSTAKYKVGDLVEFNEQKATITKVNEEDYFFSINQPYYTYDLELTVGGTLSGIAESALTLVKSGEFIKTKNNKYCECGAWAVSWAFDEHSYWCNASMYTKPKENK